MFWFLPDDTDDMERVDHIDSPDYTRWVLLRRLYILSNSGRTVWYLLTSNSHALHFLDFISTSFVKWDFEFVECVSVRVSD